MQHRDLLLMFRHGVVAVLRDVRRWTARTNRSVQGVERDDRADVALRVPDPWSPRPAAIYRVWAIYRYGPTGCGLVAAPCDTGIMCPTVVFVKGGWSDCSVPCGPGYRTRSVTCQQLPGSVVVGVQECTSRGLVQPPSSSFCAQCPVASPTIEKGYYYWMAVQVAIYTP